MKPILLCAMVAVLTCCGSESGQAGNPTVANEKPDVVLESVKIGARAAQFYIDFDTDSAVLGFSVDNEAGQPRYCPMYASTYRGIPAVTLDVFASESRDEIWVRSSWTGYPILAYHRLGTDRCITRYGEMAVVDKPMPGTLGGGTRQFPAMDINKASRVATLRYDKTSPNGTKSR